MRPYLALIKDSFRAAVASRVLYILLFVIALLLLLLAPLHMRETLDWKLIFTENVKRPEEVAQKLVEKHDSERNKPITRIWSMLPDEMRKQLTDFQKDAKASEATNDEEPEAAEAEEENDDVGRASNLEEMLVNQELLEALNDIIEDRSLYREEDWEDTSLGDEAKELIATGPDKLTDERARRLNRLLVARAFSPSIEPGTIALEFWYAIWKWDFLTTSNSHQQFAQTLTSSLSYYFDKWVIAIGLLIAILVTSNVIPDTFEPGSLNLLLSKPVSRWGLYLAKFAGGCVLVLLCACFLFVGLWLWLGIAMEVWERSLLYSIPLYVCVFAIYFSVSAFVGLVWRSPILSIIVTLIFWVLCFAVGSSHGVFAVKMANNQVTNLLPVNDNVLAMDLIQELKIKNESRNEWDVKLEAELGEDGKMQFGVNSWIIPLSSIPAPAPPPFTGLKQPIVPLFDKQSNLVFGSPFAFGQYASSRKKLSVADADELNFQTIGQFPKDTRKLFSGSNGIIAATSDGRFHRLDVDAVREKLKQVADSTAGETKITDTDFFEEIGPDRRQSIRESHLVSMNPANDRIAVYRTGRKTKLTMFDVQEDGKYKKGIEVSPETGFDSKMSCLLAYKGDTLLLAFGNGRIYSYDENTLEKNNEYHPESRSAIESIKGSPDGRYFAVRYRNNRLWILDTQQTDSKFELAKITGQGKVNAFAFDAQANLWVADNTDRAVRYDLANNSSGKRFAPSGTWVEKVYRWGLAPLYRVFPKPGEFYKVVTHLSSSGDTESNLDVDLRDQPLENANPWLPLWSGLGFMGAMLFLACLIFHFKDF